VHSILTRVVLAVAVAAGFWPNGASTALAQTRVTSLEQLKRELATGDFITIVPKVGEPVAGRLTRLGPSDLDLRRVGRRTTPDQKTQDVTIALEAIQSLERRRDSARNGAMIGAGIGAGVGCAFFVQALVVDRNEVDEWAAAYAGATAISVGLGALIGWAIDAAHSKPHLMFDAASDRKTNVRVQPAYAPGRGMALVVSISR